MRTAQQTRPSQLQAQLRTQTKSRPKTRPTPRPKITPRPEGELGTIGVRAPRATTSRVSAAVRRAPKAPFVLLVIGLMCGGLVTLLLLNVTLAQGTYKERDLRSSIDQLREQAALEEKLARKAEQPEALTSMVPPGLERDDSPPSFITSRPVDGTR
ncbi:hypothetical protein [Sphaerimonospora mesophila]|uniref:hypothetical protein n=1 Tax=Sphaerimonospora mesophila TaxID=37483 RepID=UPI0006E286CA